MAELIWQYQINKNLRETLSVSSDLPDLGRVTSINVFPEISRGEIYRGSMVVEGNIKCEIYYATEKLMDVGAFSGEEIGGIQTGSDGVETGAEDYYFEDAFQEEDLWGADDPDPEVDNEPTYCLVYNLAYRLPVEIPRLQPGQIFEFQPRVEGVDCQIADSRALEMEVGLNINLFITGEEATTYQEPPKVAAEEPEAPEAADKFMDEILEQAVKEIEDGVEAVFSGLAKKIDDENLEQMLGQLAEEVKDAVNETVEATLQETVIEDKGIEELSLEEPEVEEVVAIEDLREEEPGEVIEVVSVPEAEIPGEEVQAAAEIPAIKTGSKLFPQDTVIRINGRKDLGGSLGFQTQRLVPAYRIKFNPVQEGEPWEEKLRIVKL